MDVEFYQKLFCINWDGHMLFIPFVNVVYHIDWFVGIEKSLHLCDKSHLIWGFSLLVFCWGILCLCSSMRLACNFLFFFLMCPLFWYQSNGGHIGWVLECSYHYSFLFVCLFWGGGNFRRTGVNSYLNVCLEFACEAIWLLFVVSF